MKYFVMAALAVAFALGVLLGCSGGSSDAVVAVIDGEEFKMSLIDAYFERMGYQFESAEEEFKLKRDALDSLIDYKLLVKGGYAAGLGSDPQLERLIIAERPKFLFDALYREEVGSLLEITDQEVEEFYEKLKIEREVSHILVRTKEMADSLRKAVDDGADFGEVARQYSLDYTTAVNGGHIGFITWGTNVLPEIRDVAFSLPVGEMSPSFESENGWHILLVHREQTKELLPKREMFPFLRQTMLSRKATLAERDFIATMRQRAAVQINPEATAMLMEKLDMFYPDTISGVPRPENYFPQPDLLETYEQQMVFASYAGGELTVENYIHKIEEIPDAYRPRFDDHEGLKEVIFQIELNNIMEFEADKRGVDISEAYQERVETFRDGLVAEKFRRDILGSNIDVTEDEIIEYYNQNIESYIVPAQYHVLEIEQSIMQDAEEVLSQLQAGVEFKTIASERTTRSGMRALNGDLGFVAESRFPELYKTAQKLDVNDLSNIVVNESGRYSIIKLLEVKPKEVLPLDRVQGRIRSDISDLRRASAALDWLAQAREDAEIKVNEDVIENSIKTERSEEQG